MDEYRQWIEDGLRRPGKSQRGLARHLKVDDSAISRILSGRRAIKADELRKIQDYLGVPIPQVRPGVPILAEQTTHVRVIMVMAPGFWRSPMSPKSLNPSRETVPPLPSRIPPEQQQAVEYIAIPGAPSEFVYVTSYEVIGRPPRAGDQIWARRSSGDLTLDFIGRIGGPATKPTVDLLDGGAPVDLAAIRILGIAIGRFIPYEI